MVEWSITPVLKTGVPRGTGGSNPSLSADYIKRETSGRLPFFLWLLFQPKEERLHRMDEFIDAILEDHPDLTTRELNRLLRLQFGTYISKGRISYCEDFIDLPSYMTDTLNANDRQAWIKAHPLEESQLGQIQIKEFGTVQEQQSVGHYVRKYKQYLASFRITSFINYYLIT